MYINTLHLYMHILMLRWVERIVITVNFGIFLCIMDLYCICYNAAHVLFCITGIDLRLKCYTIFFGLPGIGSYCSVVVFLLLVAS